MYSMMPINRQGPASGGITRRPGAPIQFDPNAVQMQPGQRHANDGPLATQFAQPFAGQGGMSGDLMQQYHAMQMNPSAMQLLQRNTQGGAGAAGGAAPAQPDAFGRQMGKGDGANPQAIAYAKQRLAMMKKKYGFTPDMFGINGDPTAQWRAMSGIAGSYGALRGGQPGNYQMPQGLNPQVQAYMQSVLGLGQGPFDPNNPPVTAQPGHLAM